MAHFNSGSGIKFPSPQPMLYGSPSCLNQFTPNSTSSTNNIMFPTPPSLSSVNGVISRGGILCSASNSRPTTSPCMATSWQNNPNHTAQWAPTTVASPEMTMFNRAAAHFCTNMLTTPSSPVPSTSGVSQNALQNRSKRKSANADILPRTVCSVEEPQQKILVNEERMAARMQEMHLDNNNLDWHPDLEHQQQRNRNAEAWYNSSSSSISITTSSSQNPNGHGNDSIPDLAGVFLTNCSTSSSSASEDYDSDSSPSSPSHAGSSDSKSLQRRQRSKSCPKLDFSPELQLTLKTKRLLPRVILDELNKPCMQVMLWKPPGGNVGDIMASVEAAAKQSAEAPANLSVEVSDRSADTTPQQQQQQQAALAQPSIWSIPAGNNNSLEGIDEEPMEDFDTMEL